MKFLAVVVLICLGTVTVPADDARVAAIAALLRERPGGFGPPVADRQAWDNFLDVETRKTYLERCARLLDEPLPEQPDELYLDFSKTGNRTRWQRVANRRRGRLTTLTLAECLENKGRFLPPLEKTIRALCRERTWVMPAHDRQLNNFHGKSIDIELGSATLAHTLATVDYILADKLSPEVRKLIRQNLERRIFKPFLDMAEGRRKPNWWMQTTNNWNAVCLAGVVGAALTVIEDRTTRARFIVAAETSSKNFLRGFGPDGYCTEGLGYWNYGFGHYVILAEAVYQATGGKLDLLKRPEVLAPACFGSRIEIINGVFPSFADCNVGTRPAANLMTFLDQRFQLQLQTGNIRSRPSLRGGLVEILMYSFPNSSADPAGRIRSNFNSTRERLRTWFDSSGILICRPGSDSGTFGVALKGGHNAEHHNHNDVGSYVVVVGNDPVLLDPGSEVYTARTFSRQRYVSKVLNSYGHPVPVVAGKLQKSGRAAAAKVLAVEFSDTTDRFVLDLKAAYDVPALTRLTRTFVYSRKAAGLTVIDEVEFTEPRSFGTAIITLGGWQKLRPGLLQVYSREEAVEVAITSDVEYKVRAEVLKEDVRTPSLPTRIGIDLIKPVRRAKIQLVIRRADLQRQGMLRNGGFEMQSFGWLIPRKGISSLSTARAATGKTSLHIKDTSSTSGSNVSSCFIPIKDRRPLAIRGKVFGVAGDREALGVYIKYFDAAGKLLNEQSRPGWLTAVGNLGGADGRWRDFSFRFTPPAGTVKLQVWLHSYNRAKGELFLDDLEIVPAP